MKIIDGENYLEDVKELIIEYTKILNRDLRFQNIEDELKDLSKKYTYPHGKILVALIEDQVVGCVAYHKHNKERCEMKRLFVKKEYRKQKIGEKLVNKIIETAKEDGYQEMVLDTIEPLKSAIYLYKKFGFKECQPYYDNPMNDVIYMSLNLKDKE